MPDWWPRLLLFVFVTHAPFFALRWWRRRELRFLASTITFVLLALTYGLRVFAPELSFAGVALFWWVRIPAWGAAVISIGLLAHHGLQRLRSRS